MRIKYEVCISHKVMMGLWEEFDYDEHVWVNGKDNDECTKKAFKFGEDKMKFYPKAKILNIYQKTDEEVL